MALGWANGGMAETMASETAKYRYRVDADDRITWVNESWLAFARENGAADLDQAAVLGRSLWDYVAGGATRRLYDQAHQRVRSSGKPVVLPFRCDSPTVQRHMRLTIARGEDAQLAYECVVVRVAPQDYLVLLDAKHQRSDSFLTMCSCCKRSLLESVGWLDARAVTERLRLVNVLAAPALRHTLCPECERLLQNAPNGGAA